MGYTPTFDHPLPMDYAELTKAGQKQARLRVVCDTSSANACVIGWHYFRMFYLVPFAGFYRDFVSSPNFHYQMIEDLYNYTKNVQAAPRGTAKSFVIGMEIPIQILCTQPNSDTALLLATQDMVEERFGMIMLQLDENPFILEDFGRLKPGARKAGTWSKKYLRLGNNAVLKGMCIGGRKRGARPDLLIMDDPEADKTGKEITQQLREEFDMMLFQVILPMFRKGSKLFWVGTLMSRRAFIYAAFYGKDKRFGKWNRHLYAACREEDGRLVDLLWPEMQDEAYLEEKRDDMGPAGFAAEYLNAPSSSQARLLYRDVIKNTYRINGKLASLPLNTPSEVTVHYNIKKEKDKDAHVKHAPPEYVDVIEPYTHWLEGLFRVTLIDYAHTVSAHSDFNCVLTVGFDHRDIMWILDCWVGRLESERVISVIMAQGLKWRSHMVCPEAVAIQMRLMEEAARRIQDDSAVTGWSPTVIPPTYPANTAKGDRAALGLQWRFERGRIKYLAEDTPAQCGYNADSISGFRVLNQQTDDFTTDLALLPHDDAIDTLAMSAYIPRQSGVPRHLEPFADTPLELLKRGERFWPGTSLSLLSAVETKDITMEILDKFRSRNQSVTRGRPRLTPTRFDDNRAFLRGL